MLLLGLLIVMLIFDQGNVCCTGCREAMVGLAIPTALFFILWDRTYA